MAEPARPLRADAARNRARVLEIAYETFAAEGLGVPIDEIARRAGVGAGTVYRHFPTKEDLYRAVVEDRIRRITDDGRVLVRQAMVTYGQGVRDNFLGKLSRPQIAAMGENCRRISVALKSTPSGAKVGRV